MDERISVQEYFKDLVDQLEEHVIKNIERTDLIMPFSFEEIVEELNAFTELFPEKASNLLRELNVERRLHQIERRNEQCKTEPFKQIRRLTDSEVSSKLNIDEIYAILEAVKTKIKSQIMKKDAIGDADTGYMTSFLIEMIQRYGNNLINQYMGFMSKSQKYEIPSELDSIITHLMSDHEIIKGDRERLLAEIDEIFANFQKLLENGQVVEGVGYGNIRDRIEEYEQQPNFPSTSISASGPSHKVVFDNPQLEKIVREKEQIIDLEKRNQVKMYIEAINGITKKVKQFASEMPEEQYNFFSSMIEMLKKNLMDIESTIGIGFFTGEEIKFEPVNDLQQQENNPIITPNDIPVYQRDEMMRHLGRQDLQRVNRNEKECYIVDSPVTDPVTGEIVKRGVIWTTKAYETVCTDIIGKSELFRYVEEKTETYMTLDEAIELGLYDDRKRKTKETSKNEYDDYSPFGAG